SSSLSCAAPCSSLFPYTTLFRSLLVELGVVEHAADLAHGGLDRLLERDVGGLERRTVVIVEVVLLGPHDREAVGGHGDLHRLVRSEEHTSELQSRFDLVCRLLLE